MYVLPAYTGGDPSASRVAVSNLAPWHYAALLVHIFPAVVALVVGPLQFSAVLRRHRRAHRAIGRVYVGSVVLGSLGGAVVGALSAAGPTAWVGFVLLDALWATTTIAGWRAARQHRYADHAVWMTRSYALTFAGVTLRVWFILLILALQPLLGSYFHGDSDLLMSQAYLVTPWVSWVPNLLVGEILVAGCADSSPTVRRRPPQPAAAPISSAPLRLPEPNRCRGTASTPKPNDRELLARVSRPGSSTPSSVHGMPLEDRAAWARVARDTAGVFAQLRTSYATPRQVAAVREHVPGYTSPCSSTPAGPRGRPTDGW